MRLITLFTCLLVVTSLSLHAEISLSRVNSCLCEGQPTQAFELTATGTAGPFTFEWAGPSGFTSTDQNPLISEAGQYSVTITNIYGCSMTLYDNLPACTGIESLDLQVQADCGGQGGNILTEVMGGAPGFLNHVWTYEGGDDPINYYTPNLYNVPAGLYNLIVTDQQGCSITGQAEVLDSPDEPALSIIAEIIPACTPSTGRIALEILGAENPVITWSYSDSGETSLSNLASGIYRVTVTDDNGCGAVGQYYVPSGPVVEASITPATCLEGTDDGRIELSVSGATISSLTWEDDETLDDVTIRDNLAAGDYTVKITTVNGCVESHTFSVKPTEPTNIYPYLERVVIAAIGPGIFTRIYDGQWLPTSDDCLIFSGGVQNLSPDLLEAMSNGLVSWEVEALFSEAISGGSVSYSSSTGLSGVAFIGYIEEGDTHVFDVTNSEVQNIIQNNIINFSLDYTAYDTDTEANPIIDLLTASNGLESCVKIPVFDPILCEWTPSNIVSGGDKTHRIKSDCAPLEIFIEENEETLCFQSPGGGIPDDIAGIFWQDPDLNTFSGGYCFSITEEMYGEYCVTVKFLSGCVVTLCTNYCQRPVSFSIEEVLENPTCSSSQDGAICLEVDASIPLIFNWGNDNTDNCLSGIPSGEYTVTITAANCDITQGFPFIYRATLISEEMPLSFISSSVPTCAFSSNTGEACVYPQGGTPPYTITWFNGNQTNCITELGAGCYSFGIVDQCGTLIEDCIQVNETLAEEPSITIIDNDYESCFPSLEFVLTTPTTNNPFVVTIRRSDNLYSFTQSGMENFIFENIPVGFYQVYVEGFCGSLYEYGPFSVQRPHNPPTLIGEVETTPSCSNNPSGRLFFEVEGEDAPFIYKLTRPLTLPVLSEEPSFGNLYPTEYTLIIIDACGYEFNMGTYQIQETLFSAGVNSKAICKGELGDIYIDPIIEPILETPIFNYEWSNGATSQNLIQVDPGSYQVTITEAISGCVLVEEIDLEIRTLVPISEEIIHATGSSLGQILLEFEDSESLAFLWSNGDQTEDLLDASPGEYSLMVIDESGCEFFFEFTLLSCSIFDELYVSFLEIEHDLEGNGTGSIDLEIYSTHSLTIEWFGPNGFSSNSSQIENLISGVYTATIVDECGRNLERNYTIIGVGGCEDFDEWQETWHAPYADIFYEIQDPCVDGWNLERSAIIISHFDCLPNPEGLSEREFYIEITGTNSAFTTVSGSVSLGYESGAPGTVTDGECYVLPQSEPLRKTIVPDPATGTVDIYTVTITNDLGCTTTKNFTFGKQRTSGTFYADLTDITEGWLANPFLQPLYSSFHALVGNWKCDICEFVEPTSIPWQACIGDPQTRLFSYEPTNRQNPCTLGGTLTYFPVNGQTGAFSPGIDIEVDPNSAALSFQSDSGVDCGCLFPAGTISGLPPTFENEYYVGNGGFLVLPIYVEFPCAATSEPPIIAECDYDLDLGIECDNCALLPSPTVDCAVDVVCFDNGEPEVLIEGLEPSGDGLLYGCIRELANGNYQVVTPCATDPCNQDVIDVISGEYTEENIEQLFIDYGWLSEELWYCGNCLNEDGFLPPDDPVYGLLGDGNNRTNERTGTRLHQERRESLSTKQLILFPNPGVDELIVQFNPEKLSNVQSIQIQSLLGSTHYFKNLEGYSSSRLRVNTSSWSYGVYWLTVVRKDGTINTYKWAKAK